MYQVSHQRFYKTEDSWMGIHKCWGKKKTMPTGFLYLVKISSKNGGIINIFSNIKRVYCQRPIIQDTWKKFLRQRNMKYDGNLTLNSLKDIAKPIQYCKVK